MIIDKSTSIEIEQSPVEFKQKFGIRSNDLSKILKFLRTKLYSDKIGSVCREIASNSRDANTESGQETPITISILSPNSLLSINTLSISFKDSGTGISPERVSEIFLNYGASDKENSNAYIGGMGIGSKSPFAYTDSFNVITVYQGIKYFYNIYIDESECGEGALLYSMETNEPSGTEVIIPIEESDKLSFEHKIIWATFMWSIKPTLVGFSKTYPTFKPVFQDKNFSAYQFSEFNNYFSIGNNVYANNAGILYPLTSLTSNVTKLEGHVIVVNFEIGEVAVTISRESLEYTPKTQVIIDTKWEKVIETLQAEYKQFIGTSKNKLEEYIKENKIQREYGFYSRIRNSFHTLKSKNLPSLDYHSFITKTNSPFKWNLSEAPAVLFYADKDITVKKLDFLAKLYDSFAIVKPSRITRLRETQKRDKTQVENDYVSRTAAKKKELEDTIQNLGYDLIPLSTIQFEKEKKEKATELFITANTLDYKLTSFNSGVHNFKIKTCDPSKLLFVSGLEVPDNDFIYFPMKERVTVTNLEYNDTAIALKIAGFLLGKKVLVIKPTKVKFFSKQMSIEAALLAIQSDKKLQLLSDYLSLHDEWQSLNETIKGLKVIPAINQLSQCFTDANRKCFYSLEADYIYQSTKNIIYQLQPPSGEVAKIKGSLESLYKEYPMLGYTVGFRGKINLKELEEYIQLINNKVNIFK